MAHTYVYPRPAVTVDSVIFSESEDGLYILLIQRKNPPYQDYWAIPGGFVDMDEELDVAAKRELLEETGLVVEHLEQFKTFGTLNRDPRGRTVSIVYYAFADKEHAEIKANDDASDVEWYNVNELPKLAFDHNDIIEQLLESL